MGAISSGDSVDWVAAYNDLHYLLVLERAGRLLGLCPSLTTLLEELYGRTDRTERRERDG